MKTRMCICGFLALAISSICMLRGEETTPGGIVYGPKATFKISAPSDWVLDNSAGVEEGLPCVLYRKGSSWQEAKTIMYAKITSPEFTDAEAFAARAIKEMKGNHGTPKRRILWLPPRRSTASCSRQQGHFR